jgi:hypothetical protein
MWYGYNTPLAKLCGMGTITPSADIHWPMWIGPLSSWVACVVQEVPLKGLSIMPFNSPDTSGTAVIIGSHTIHLHNVKEVTLDTYNCSLAAVQKLTFDNPLFNISDDETIHNDPRNIEPNWSFVKHPLNSWNARSTPMLLEFIISTPEIFGITMHKETLYGNLKHAINTCGNSSSSTWTCSLQ